MDQRPNSPQLYVCPKHPDVRLPSPGECPTCGMALLPEGTRFGLLRHVFSSPLHLAIMTLVMLAAIAAVMVLLTRYAR